MAENTAQSRRDVLKATGAAGAAGLVGLAGCTGNGNGNGGGMEEDYPALGNYPIEGDTATLGFNVPQTGSYQEEGADELLGYQLAVEHLNNGGGWVDMWDDLSGDGVNGYTIDSVNGDTATDPDTARESGQRMISRDNVIMFTGGSSSATAIAQQGMAQNEKVLYMCCITHSNDTTGKDCTRYGFREMFNAYMTGQALAPIVIDEYGEGLDFYQEYADYSWGQTQQASMRQFFEAGGWNEVESVGTPFPGEDFSTYHQQARNSGADVLFLNHYGTDLANSLSQAIDMGIDEDMEIVVPLYNEPMVNASGDAIEGIYGTVDWSTQLDDEYTNTFVEAFEAAHDGDSPSYAARIAYTQTLQYAAAVERAGTFYPPEVIRELEDHEYNNAGLGDEIMRECDHQAMRDILVVQGNSVAQQEETGNPYELIERSAYPDDVGYDCETGPAAECELGDYGDE